MTDEEIIKRVQKGEIDLYEQLVERYKDRIFGFIYKYTNDYSESQDVAQEVFLKIFKYVHSFRGQSKVSTWFYKIATNSCIDWDRKRKKHKGMIFLNNEEMIEDEKYSPEAQWLLEEQRQMVREIVGNLSEKYKLLVVMYHFHNLKYREISEILDIPIKTVETRLYRARAIIKNEIQKQYKGGEIL